MIIQKQDARKSTRKYFSAIFSAAVNPFSNRRFIFFPVLFGAAAAYGQAPVISYSSPQVYTVSTTITPLTPTNTGGAVPGQTPVVIGSLSNALSAATDAAGNVYVANFGANKIKKFPAGGGTATAIGSGFNGPTGVAVDAAGNIYVADNGNNAVKEIPAGGGAIITLGSGFNKPYGVAIDAAGNLYVSDSGTNLIKEIRAGNDTVFALASGFNAPAGIALDNAGNLYIADSGDNLVKKLPNGSNTPVTIGSGFNDPIDVAVDAAGNVYVADSKNQAVKMIPADGSSIVSIGSGFGNPAGVAVDATGNVFVVDSFKGNLSEVLYGGYSIKPVLSAGLTFNVHTGVISGTPSINRPAKTYTVTAFNASGSGTATVNITVNVPVKPNVSYSTPQTYTVGTAIPQLNPSNSGGAVGTQNEKTLYSGFSSPTATATDAAGDVYVAESGSNDIREIRLSGGTPIVVGSGFNKPTGIAGDAAGNIYVADNGNNAIKKIAVGTGVITTLGSGFSAPYGIAVDASGNIYVGDSGNNAVKKIPAGGGSVVTLGSGFNNPAGVAVDASGNVYVADKGTNSVKEIPGGTGTPIVLGSGFSAPTGVSVDASGNVYVADAGNHLVKIVLASGGSPIVLISGSGVPAGVATDGAGNIYIADTGNGTVNEITPGGYFVTPALPAGLHLDPVYGPITGTPTAAAPATNYMVTVFNAGGSSTATINITVNLPQKPAISYSSPQTYYVNVQILPLQPANTGGAVQSGGYGISPALPAGLSFDNNTGIISGTPTATSAATNYTVTALNSAGSGTATINITVNPYQLPTVSYASPQVYPLGTAIAPLTPTSSAVAPAGYPQTTNQTISTAFNNPFGMAVSQTGIVYVADNGNNAVKKIFPGGSIVTVGPGFNHPTGVAVDSTGNVYVADYGNNAIKKVPVGGGAVVTLGSGFSGPYGIAVDTAGNVYVGDSNNNQVKKIPAGSNTPVVIGTGFSHPTGVAVDVFGNVYVADLGNNTVKEILASDGSTITIGSGRPNGVAVDNAGNVYFADEESGTGKDNEGTGSITEIPAGGGSPVNVGGNLTAPFAVAVSNTNVVYVTELNNNGVYAITPTGGFYIAPHLPPGLNYDNNTGTISGTPTAESAAKYYWVTAYNSGGSASAPVNIKVTNPANLAQLVISSGGLTPAFSPDTVNYKVLVAQSVSSVTIKPTTLYASSTIKVNGTTVASGTASAPISLNTGPNTITTVVTAQDGVTTKTYTITVYKGSTNAALANLKLSSGTLSPAFSHTTYAYTASVANTVSSITVTPTAADPMATITVNGTTVATKTASGPIPLTVGPNTITTVVTAQNGASTQTYTVTVTRAASNDAYLSNLKLSDGTLTPAFAFKTMAYTAGVANTVSTITVTPTTIEANATIKVNGTPVASGTASGSIPLSVGANGITIIVTAQDGTTKQIYTVKVTRAAGSANSVYMPVGVENPVESLQPANDGIKVHNGISPNGDGIDDFLQIDNISQYPDNKLMIMNRNGLLVYEAKGYDNSSKVFDGHSNKNGAMQLPGTYFYALDYTANGVTKHKTGFIVLKY